MEFSIRVVDEDGDPVSDKKITIDYGLFNGQESEFTNNDGWAEFSPSNRYVTCTVYIGGESYGELPIEDGETYSFVYDP